MYFYGIRKSADRVAIYLDEECSMMAGYIYMDESTEPISIKVMTFDKLLEIEESDDDCEDDTPYGGEDIRPCDSGFSRHKCIACESECWIDNYKPDDDITA